MTFHEQVALAQKIQELERLEDEHAQAKCKRETAERLATKFEPGSEWQRAWAKRFAERTVVLREMRRKLAQQIFDAYAVGVGKDGQIIWESDQI